MIPTDDQLEDFLTKVGPIAEALAEEKGVKFVSRHVNLAMGIKPKSKKETRFRDEILRRVWRAYPNDRYPELCIEPAKPTLRVVK